jgi:hypothetical protein
MRRHDLFCVRISLEEPLLKPCPEGCHIRIFQKRKVAGLVEEKAFPENQDFVLRVVPGLRIADIFVPDPCDLGAGGFAHNVSCVGVVFGLDDQAHHDIGLQDVGMQQVVGTRSFQVVDVLSLETVAYPANVIAFFRNMDLPVDR